MPNPILYEHPLNERVRAFLRLEYFFGHATYFQRSQNAIETQVGVNNLIEILNILDRNDLRSDLIKELDRQITYLTRHLQNPDVDRRRLDLILEKLNDQIHQIHQSRGKLGSEIRENELLISIRQRAAIAAGTCGFDLPAYHYLLNQELPIRAAFLNRCLAEFMPMKEGIDLLLSLIRNSANFERQSSENGFYQKTLEVQNACQLVRIMLPSDFQGYPEIIGSKHRVNVRFLAFTETGRPRQIIHPQEFEISFCTM